MSNLATLRVDGPIARLVINRPDARNALSIELLGALHDRLDELTHTHAGAHVLVISGAGKAFCAGMDLKQIVGDAALAGRLLSGLGDLTTKIRRLPLTVLGAVNGPAIGGGCGIVTVCDLAITFADNKMGFPEVDLGICPAVVAPWLVRKVGPGRARQILLTGGLMSGAEALAHGIVTQCVPTLADLEPAVEAMATRLAAGGPAAMRATKSLLNELDGSMDDAILREAAAISASIVGSPETQATLKARLKA
ncbi:MAG: enoyl-CoA hydratase/isomerase family protein [Phycisphaeraceae bacterium]|nr:enoyl-CoA hydratase/isomerase family protein [Phycisphaeraceae bacterium]